MWPPRQPLAPCPVHDLAPLRAVSDDLKGKSTGGSATMPSPCCKVVPFCEQSMKQASCRQWWQVLPFILRRWPPEGWRRPTPRPSLCLACQLAATDWPKSTGMAKKNSLSEVAKTIDWCYFRQSWAGRQAHRHARLRGCTGSRCRIWAKSSCILK